MRARLFLPALLAVLVAAVLSASAGAVISGWTAGIEVPGTAGSNDGGYAQVTSVSCPSARVCVATGFYKQFGRLEPFVVSERDGKWGDALQVPGIVNLNTDGAVLYSVSCAAAGACLAGGYYTDSSLRSQAFVVSERHGRWGDAFEVPGTAALNHGADGHVNSVSCAAPGSCVVGGVYTGRRGHSQGFVAGEIDGHWTDAIRVRGSAYLNRGLDARVYSVSCGAVGECVAGGQYTDGSGIPRPFVEVMKHRHWGGAIEVARTPLLDLGDAAVNSVSCTGTSTCVAGGDAPSSGEGFIVSETHGRWSHAVAVSGRVLLPGSRPLVTSVSCAAPGTCVVGGMYLDDLVQKAFVVSSKGGRWGQAIEVPGTGVLNTEGNAQVTSVSCGAGGTCAAGGRYSDDTGHFQAFVATERRGRWRTAVRVPGIAALNSGDSQVNAVSCAASGPCVAGGTYQDASSGYQAFVAARP